MKSYVVIFIILDSSKNLTKQQEKHECWYNDFVKKKSKKKSVKYTVGGLDCFCRAANAINVTYNIDVHWFHNIKNQEWSVIGLPVCVRFCVCVHTRWQENVCLWLSVLLRECLIFHQHARALLVVHATSRTHHAYGNKLDVTRQLQDLNVSIHFISSFLWSMWGIMEARQRYSKQYWQEWTMNPHLGMNLLGQKVHFFSLKSNN